MQEINKFRVFKTGGGKKSRYYTKSIYKGYKGFSEKVDRFQGSEYREILPERSKLIAAIAKGISQIGIKEGKSVLYLGASHGYTPSFVSDMVGTSGTVFALDFAPRVVRDLVFVCEKRANMAPLLDDAFHPENYNELVPKVDIVYQDIAQKNQVEIFLKNCAVFLKEGGFGLLALKARSVDVTKKPGEIFNAAEKELSSELMIVDKRKLDPFEKDHIFFVVKKK